MAKLSVVMITKNCADVLPDALSSVKGLADEIVIVDDGSTDSTRKIAQAYNAKIYLKKDANLGRKKQFGVRKATGDWVLVLDSDERVSDSLRKKIKKIISSERMHSGYRISYQNHFLGRPVRYGGEDYKMLRLFKRTNADISSALVHEHFQVKKGTVGTVSEKINHYSYRSLPQMYRKFTDYALREARERTQKGEKTSLPKIVLYAPHMFYARYIKDKGYRDGAFRIPLDLGFAYMEFLTYTSMIFMSSKKK